MTKRLRKRGFRFDRPGPGSHEIWRHAETGRRVTPPHPPRDTNSPQQSSTGIHARPLRLE
ncbi:MAG: type II toxin-antitoxin system HicA family toxin [Phycisphaerae bacterium]|nr:type II toxin-antitoxin system HicA family toxin [Phycisphaerae bacterium]